MSSIFHGSPAQFGGAIDLSGGVSMQVGVHRFGDFGGAAGAAGAAKANLAVQTAQIQGQRPLQPFYDLFSNNIYYVIGRVVVNGSMDRILGPKGSMAALYEDLTDPCMIGANNMTLAFAGKFCEGGKLRDAQRGNLDVLAGGNSFDLKNVAMTSFGLTLRAQDFVFMEQFSFNAADIEQGGQG